MSDSITSMYGSKHVAYPGYTDLPEARMSLIRYSTTNFVVNVRSALNRFNKSRAMV